jgi:hypothetical protein
MISLRTVPLLLAGALVACDDDPVDPMIPDPTTFEVRIENVSTVYPHSSDGGVAPMVLAPGVSAVADRGGILFTSGAADRGQGLEALAEDGNPSGLAGDEGSGEG